MKTKHIKLPKNMELRIETRRRVPGDCPGCGRGQQFSFELSKRNRYMEVLTPKHDVFVQYLRQVRVVRVIPRGDEQ